MVLPGGFLINNSTNNNNLYNGQSEWQNDYGNLPDYYQALNRNYDAVLGRFISVDPMPESAESMTTYQYAGNNPVMMNDPSGNEYAAPGVWKTANPVNDVSEWEYAQTGGLYARDPGLGNILATQSVTTVYHSGAGGGQQVGNLSDAIALIYQITGQIVGSQSPAGGGTTFYLNSNGQIINVVYNPNASGVNYYMGSLVNQNGHMVTVGQYYLTFDQASSLMANANQGGIGQYPRGAIGGPVPWYGNFLGPGPDGNPYNLRGYDGKILRPIDMLDAAAQRHDYAYYKAHTGGVSGALFNRSVRDADLALSAAAQWTIIYSWLGINDPVSGKPVSSSELKWAWGVFGAFTDLGTLKKF